MPLHDLYKYVVSYSGDTFYHYGRSAMLFPVITDPSPQELEWLHILTMKIDRKFSNYGGTIGGIIAVKRDKMYAWPTPLTYRVEEQIPSIFKSKYVDFRIQFIPGYNKWNLKRWHLKERYTSGQEWRRLMLANSNMQRLIEEMPLYIPYPD